LATGKTVWFATCKPYEVILPIKSAEEWVSPINVAAQ
jgi:hypothetical protein